MAATKQDEFIDFGNTGESQQGDEPTGRPTESPPAADPAGDLAEQLRRQRLLNDELSQRLSHIERMLTEVAPDVGKPVKVPPLNREGLTEDKLAKVAEFLVTFKGPDEAKWAQPVRVEALNESMAIATVVKATGIAAELYVFKARYMGKTFRVRPPDKEKKVAGFPRNIYARSAEDALRLARTRAENFEDELIAEPV